VFPGRPDCGPAPISRGVSLFLSKPDSARGTNNRVLAIGQTVREVPYGTGYLQAGDRRELVFGGRVAQARIDSSVRFTANLDHCVSAG